MPQKLLYDIFEVHKKCEEFSDEFEDFLLANDGNFINKIKKSRKEHIEGKTRDIKKLKQELNK